MRVHRNGYFLTLEDVNQFNFKEGNLDIFIKTFKNFISFDLVISILGIYLSIQGGSPLYCVQYPLGSEIRESGLFKYL